MIAQMMSTTTMALLLATQAMGDGYNDIPHTAFPVIPEVLRPGALNRVIQFKPTPMAPPMFIIGIDKYSVQWIRKNHRYLKSRNAIGLVVHARDNADLLALKELSGIQTLFVVADRSLADAWQMKTYPVFIDTKAGEIKQ